MKRKILSMVLAAAMSFAAVVPYVNAEDDIRVGTPDNWFGSNTTYYVTTEESYSGKASLVSKGANNSQNVELLQSVSYDSNTKYRVTVYAKIINNWFWNVKAYLGKTTTADGIDVQHMNTGYTRTATEKAGWYKYEADYKPAADGNFHILKLSDNSGFWMYIDDVSVYALDDNGNVTGDNLIKNGAFESFTEFKPSINVTPGDGKLTVNWTNPAVASTAVNVTVGGEAVDVSSANLAANATNSVVVENLENGKEYEVVVTNTTAYGEGVNNFTIIPRAPKTGYAENWTNAMSYPITTEESYSGISSIKMGLQDGTEILQSVDYDPEQLYKVTLYAKVKPDWGFSWMAKAWLGSESAIGGNGVQHLNDKGGWTYTDVENGWRKYEATYKPGADNNEYFHIKSQAGDGRFVAYIDNLSVVPVDASGNAIGENLIKNGDFEVYREFKSVVSAKGDDGKLTVTWTNPGVASSAVSLTVGGQSVDVSSANLEANASNSVEVAGLTNNEKYEIVVTNTTAYGTYSATVYEYPRIITTGTINSWYGSLDRYIATTEESYSGMASLKFTGANNNVSVQLLQSVKYDANKKYKVTVYAKEHANWFWNIKAYLGQTTTADGNDVQHMNTPFFRSGKTATEKAGWYKFETVYQPASDGNFHIVGFTDDANLAMYLDDISVYELDENGNTIGDNLIVNGGFENFTAPSDAAKDAYFDAGYVCWTVDGTPDCFKVYKVVDGQRNLISVTESGKVDYCEVGAVNDGDEFVITSVYGGYETKGVTLKAELSVEAIFGTGSIAENGDITITDELDEIQAGAIVAGVKILNYVSTPVKPDVFVALYNGGKLISVNKLTLSQIAAYGESEAAALVTVPEIGETDSYEIKVFTWNTDMSAICGDFLLD